MMDEASGKQAQEKDNYHCDQEYHPAKPGLLTDVFVQGSHILKC